MDSSKIFEFHGFIQDLRVPVTVKYVTRIGNANEAKSRPIKVIFANEDKKSSVMGSLVKLKQYPGYKSVSVTEDTHRLSENYSKLGLQKQKEETNKKILIPTTTGEFEDLQKTGFDWRSVRASTEEVSEDDDVNDFYMSANSTIINNAELDETDLISEVECECVDCHKLKSSFSNCKTFSLFHINISSLSKHFDELTAFLEEDLRHDFKILGISETRLTKLRRNMHNIEIPNYSVYTIKRNLLPCIYIVL